MEKLFITLPYHIKEKGKQLGAMYDIENKSWYVLNKNDLKQFNLVDVYVDYELKDLAKENGAIWNFEKKVWQTCSFNLDWLNQLLNDDKTKNLIFKRNKLNKNPQVKILKEIEKMESLIDPNSNSNKMIFPKW